MTESLRVRGLARYQRVAKLGHGGYGVVYKAIDRETGERVAVKELTHVNPTTLMQFKKEFRAVQEVHHPNLARLDALFQDDDKWFIAMELVEGTDLLDHLYVDRDARCYDEEQLRDVFGQLALGLAALHAAGFVHRDLKPKNVRVTPEGRAVLLDFGLATTIDPRNQSQYATGLGTVAYMAPEQAQLRKVGPAADWYAFGVCLFEALTGVLPIDGETPFLLLQSKQQTAVLPPSSQAADVPRDLDELCVSLLAVEPRERPSARFVRGVLGQASPEVSSLPPAAWGRDPQRSAPAFIGRDRELQQLQRAFERAGEGSQRIVLVEGESGIGKSALVEYFLSHVDSALLLRSRCYENELVAYKAFDAAVEQLAAYLSELLPEQCAALLPPNAALLCRLFPALESVPSLSAGALMGLPADPGAQRLEAFSIFSDLLFRLGEQRPIVLAIDDIQWADAESFSLLRAWLSLQRARCLVIATVRPRAELEGDAARRIAELRTLDCVEDLAVAGLPAAAARAITRRLMGRDIPETWLDAIVNEGQGHPLFLTVLSRFAGSRDPTTDAEVNLDAAILSRIGSLPVKQRRLLETVAVASAPLAAPLCGRASQLEEKELRQLATELCRQKLLRRRRAGDLACFHDRIRRVTVESLPVEQKRQVHARIAAALAVQSQVDPAQLARHHEAAGEYAAALDAYRLAGERALLALAFARAASLYERAIAMSLGLAQDPPSRVALRSAMGHALAREGRSAEAAREYLEAARAAQGEDGVRLRTLAAVHLLQSARVEEGLGAARALLDELGLGMPSSPAATVARLLWDRACFGLGELRTRTRPSQVDVQARMRLEALWGLAAPIAWLDPLASAGLITRHLRLAQAAGEPTHMARALAQEAFARHLRDPRHPRVGELIGRARQICDACSDPALDMSIAFHEGTIAIGALQLATARERLEHAHKVGAESCPDEPWLLTNVRISLNCVYTLLGEHARLATGSAAWLAEARDRNDQFALTLIETTGMGHLRHLMADEPERARATVDEALRPWPREPFSFAHYGEVFGVIHSELYRGGDAAYRWIERELPRLSASFVLKTPFAKVGWLLFRANAALAAHATASGEEPERLLREAQAYAVQLKKIDSPVAAVHADLIEGQVLALRGDGAAALQRVRAIRRVAGPAGSDMLDRSVQYLEGVLEGEPAGAQQREAALTFFAAQGWKQPRRALSITCGALDALESRTDRAAKPG